MNNTWQAMCRCERSAFRDSEATISDRMFLIKETGLESLPGTRNLGGNEIRIENCPYSAAVVLTQDPLDHQQAQPIVSSNQPGNRHFRCIPN